MLSDHEIEILDVSSFSYAERVCAAAVQGIVNRERAIVFLDYGFYDDLDARQTNEVFMDDKYWYGKYRAMLGNQDQHNLEYYKTEHHMIPRKEKDLQSLVKNHRSLFTGLVIWDNLQPDTVNLAIMMAAQENLLVINTELEEWARQFELPLIHDLRSAWSDHIEMYRWAFQNLFVKCKPGVVSCIEPGWKRPEFVDYVVQNKIFTYSLSSSVKGFGSTLLLLLAFGPPKLREILFALRLDGFLRWLGLTWMGWKSAEVHLSNQIQRAIAALPYPTIFGWHTRRDDELSFMLQLSSNGMRLVPSHLAGNFSFHSRVKPLGTFAADPLPEVTLDPQGIYLTFTLSDGDQLMMMNTGELGNWYSANRGSTAFNWETQPLLAEFAPALLEKFTRTKTARDCLIAGPSGAGYIVPPLAPDFVSYMKETASVCQKAGIRVVTTYVADPPRRVQNQLVKNKGKILGFLSGYAIIKRAPQTCITDTVLLANEIPEVSHIWDTSDQLLETLAKKIASPGSLPRFISVHLFAYRTSLDDVVQFVNSLSSNHIHIVRADEFLIAAEQFLNRSTT